LTFPSIYDIVIERMEELRSFFYAQNFTCPKRKDPQTMNFESGGGSRAHKNYTGMYGMQTT